jgi:hypothetical protein
MFMLSQLSFSLPPRVFRRTLVFLLTALLALAPLNFAFAQQQDSIKRLKEQIAVMAEIQNRPDVPVEVKETNASFLRERRQRLRAMLQSRVDAMRAYRGTAGIGLTAEEFSVIDKSIQSLESELQDLNATVSNTPVATTTTATSITATSPTAPQPVAAAPTQPPPPVQAECYPEAPRALVDTVTAAADQIVDRDDPDEVTSQFFQILFFATAHAVSVDAVNEDEQKRDLINRIEIARLQQETKRTDKQIGASARSEGSTTIAEKPGFAELLGFAVEHGAVQQEVNGTTLTLSSSPYAFVAAANGDTATTYKNFGYLSRVGVSANFNIDNEENVLTSARRSQLSEWSLRARLTPDRSQRSADAEAIWERVRSGFAAPDLVLTGELAREFGSNRTLNAKRREIEDRFLTPAFRVPVRAVLSNSALTPEQKRAQIAKTILCQVRTDIFDAIRSGAFRIDEESRTRLIQRTIPAFRDALIAKEAAIRTFEEELERLSYKPVLTFAYTNKRDPDLSDYSNFKFLFQKKSTEGFSIIANAGFSVYHKPNPLLNQTNMRDFAAALSFEGSAGRSPFMMQELDESRITFSFSGRYQRLFENRHIPGLKADIGVAQFKLELPVLMGFSLPFSVSYATSSELINEDHVRANFGFTLDTDKVFQILKMVKLQNR